MKPFFCNSLPSTSQTITHLSQLPQTVPTPTLPLLSLLQICKGAKQFNQIHGQMTLTGPIHNHPCGSIRATCSIVDRINGPDTYTWNKIIRGYLEVKNPKEAILAYTHMRREGLQIDSYTVLFVTKACGLLLGVCEGRVIHGQILKLGFGSEVIIRTVLMQTYVRCENLDHAHQVFDEIPHKDLIARNALIACYAQRDKPNEAILVFHAMVRENVRPNEVTIVSILSCCSCLGAMKEGKSVHGYAIKSLNSLDVYVYNALMNMYTKCTCLVEARQVFDKMPERNVVSWTTMINGYSDLDHLNEAMVLFGEMECANIRPDQVTILGLLSMCTRLRSLELGIWVDHYIQKNGFEEITCIANALMDMYAKCGNIHKACQVFDAMATRTVVSWTTMIQGLAMHGHGIVALVRFSQMQIQGFRPDHVAFLSVLFACSHAGLVDEGRRCFRSMRDEYGMAPSMEHYGCMVDLLCRAELVYEAFEFVDSMPMKPDVIMWRTLLGACRNQGNIDLAMHAMRHLLELEPKYSGNYILASNLYATNGQWDRVMEIREEMGIAGITRRDAACSLIEVNTK